ncbi:hypothetical protein SAMN05421781_2766 [Marinococcus luteus]|uniref:Uncharacterized protein n=1 Tax=Marinococcus luteus TaxID=1122204 RepID=A0A1H2XIV5_9BACI|nr:hypothetical protein [Marinococcus luteus]SDW92706.1 hypothetical protein SAMN05421781_2766 [Marinococcus luteus]
MRLFNNITAGAAAGVLLLASACGSDAEGAEQWITELESNGLSMQETEENPAAPVSMNHGSEMWEEDSTNTKVSVYEFDSRDAAVQAEEQFQQEVTENGGWENISYRTAVSGSMFLCAYNEDSYAFSAFMDKVSLPS